jgi:hypothetical protein
VLITARAGAWTELAVPVSVDVLDRSESVAMLHARLGALDAVDADRLAGELGDLPLALAQAGNYMYDTGGMSAYRYLELLKGRAGELLDRGRPFSYPITLTAATHLSFDRLKTVDEAAWQLATLCAFLAPDPIPAHLFTRAASALPAELAGRVTSPLGWPDTLASLKQFTRVDGNAIVMHPVTQAILSARLSHTEASDARNRLGEMLVANDPGDPAEPGNWPGWAALVPHLLAIETAVASTASTDLRQLACKGCAYLLATGETEPGGGLAVRLRERWRQSLTDDHPDTLMIAQLLAKSLRDSGDVQARLAMLGRLSD